MQQKTKNRHEFALYYSELTAHIQKNKNQLILTDQEIMHRIIRVLRLHAGEDFTLFDQQHNALVKLDSIGKKELGITILTLQNNKILIPQITFFLPILKREAFESALYSLVEVGVNTIQLITTEKTQRTVTTHELARAERTIIAAAEQSKNFNVPNLLPPINFTECVSLLHKESGLKIFFDPEGIPLYNQVTIAREKRTENISLMIGPEADLTPTEKKQLQEAGISFCALTPTILRACQAAALGGAIFRSIF